MLAAAQKAASKDVTAAAISLLESPPPDLWARAARAVGRAADKASAALEGAVQGYGLEAAELADLRAQVAAAARAQLLVHAREAAHTVLSRVKDRCAPERAGQEDSREAGGAEASIAWGPGMALLCLGCIHSHPPFPFGHPPEPIQLQRGVPAR